MSDVGRVARTERPCPNCGDTGALACWDDASDDGPPDRFACPACGQLRSVDAHTGDVLDHHAAVADPYRRWERKADENEATWGHQSVETLLLAIQEELGELTQAHLEHRDEDGRRDRIGWELDDLGALCVQLRRALDRAAAGESDEPE